MDILTQMAIDARRYRCVRLVITDAAASKVVEDIELAGPTEVDKNIDLMLDELTERGWIV